MTRVFLRRWRRLTRCSYLTSTRTDAEATVRLMSCAVIPLPNVVARALLKASASRFHRPRDGKGAETISGRRRLAVRAVSPHETGGGEVVVGEVVGGESWAARSWAAAAAGWRLTASRRARLRWRRIAYSGAPQMQTPWTRCRPVACEPRTGGGSGSSAAISGQRMLPLTPSRPALPRLRVDAGRGGLRHSSQIWPPVELTFTWISTVPATERRVG